MNSSKLLFAIAATIFFFAGFIAKGGYKKFTQFYHARFFGLPATFTFHASSYLTNMQGNPFLARTVWLVTRAGVGASTNFYTALTTGNFNMQLYLR